MEVILHFLFPLLFALAFLAICEKWAKFEFRQYIMLAAVFGLAWAGASILEMTSRDQGVELRECRATLCEVTFGDLGICEINPR